MAVTLTTSDSARLAESVADAILGFNDPELVAGAIKTLEALQGPPWPTEYVNRDTGCVYKPHHDGERKFLLDTPRYLYARGGEGGGKSVAGIKKTLDRASRKCSGIVVSPDMPHFKRSLWPEFQRWCPWDQVVEKHRHRGDFAWEPYAPFKIAFCNGAILWCGGMDEPGAWEGPNVNFAHMDEMRRKKKADVLKVLDGRVRIPTNGVPPQIYLTSTPRKNWLFDYYGPLAVKCLDCGDETPIAIQEGEEERCVKCGSFNLKVDDVHASFKRDSFVMVLLTVDNEYNLEENFARKRAQTLTEAEARVLLEAAWEDIEEGQRFLPTMLWWDDCEEEIAPLSDEPIVVALDAATGRQSGVSDCFGLLAVSRYSERRDAVAVRHIAAWQAPTGGKIDFLGTERNPGPEWELRRLCETHNVKCVVYDPRDLHDMGQRLRRERVVWMKEFGQVSQRTKADTDLLRLIQERRVAHSGERILREHVDNADRKLDSGGHTLRIVKREDQLKIDLAVCLSMAAYQCLHLNLG